MKAGAPDEGQEEDYAAAAAASNNKMLTIIPGTKYNRLFAILMTKFKAARAKGYSIDFNCLWFKARIAYRELTTDAKATIREHMITAF